MIRQPIKVHLIKVKKSKTTTCYRALIKTKIAKNLNLSNKEGILFETKGGEIFPAVIFVKKRNKRIKILWEHKKRIGGVKKMSIRQPIIAVLGHVDHGKFWDFSQNPYRQLY